MTGSDLLREIILVSEKAANISRAIRQEEHLLSLLVQEKKDGEKNPRFAQDFKTLADVLIQEVVKHDLGTKFPDLVGHIFGEESNEFSCSTGESVCLTVNKSEEETAGVLVKILGDERASTTLAHLVHSTAEVELDVPVCEMQVKGIGVWIDPIDSTAEYISGGSVPSDVPEVCSSGLPCVTVLIGVFHLDSGAPVLGVVNQPFTQLTGERWTGNIVWGVSDSRNKLCSLPDPTGPQGHKVVVLSSSESEGVKSRLTSGGFTLVEAAGAGYKLLCVATRLVHAYVLSKPSTFYWDTCGVQAVLEARGGGIVDFSDALEGDVHPLRYKEGSGVAQCCNRGGFIAYNDQAVMQEILALLK